MSKRKSTTIEGFFGLDGYTDPDFAKFNKNAEKSATRASNEQVNITPTPAPTQTPAPTPTPAQEGDRIRKEAAEATKQYVRKTSGLGAKVSKLAAVILGAATGGLVGLNYVETGNKLKDLQYYNDYQAQIIELQKQSIEVLHQAGVNMGSIGNVYNSGIIMNQIFGTETNGHFDQALAGNPELKTQIINDFNDILGGNNMEALNSFAAAHGYTDWSTYSASMNEKFSGIFMSDGTIAPETTMSQISEYYTIMSSYYCYAGNEAIKQNANELFMAGLSGQEIEGLKFTVNEVLDANGNVIGSTLGTEIAPEAIEATRSDWSLGEMATVGIVSCLSMAGVYWAASRVLGKVSNYFTDRQIRAELTANGCTDDLNNNIETKNAQADEQVR